MDLPGGLNEQRVMGRGATPAMPKRPPAFDLKGTMAPLTVLRLRSSDIQMVDRQLRVRISQLPHMFLHAPVLIDLGALEEASSLTIIQVVAILKACKLVPVAAINVPEAMRAAIASEGLGILQAPPSAGRERNLDAEIDAMPDPDLPTPPPERIKPAPKVFLGRAVPPRAPGPAPAPVIQPPFAGPVVVRQPVRSGQVIYAQGNDLVVLAPVNAGAQVVADGHVHIYAKLRGRAVAGAKGLTGARIFCQKLEAELVAVSDKYMSADEIPPALRGKPAQIWLENGECKAAPL
ncbi:MAG TPA: septum site-determining protein MinC [Polyangia bacterium]|jgi:septum site-determining protein MinC|nr:septum site-determining protein MinC [Polyangia bacterium]